MAQDANSLEGLSSRIDNLAVEVENLSSKVSSAFLLDEYDKTDFIGHRAYHRKKQISEKELEQSKIILTRNIATWAIIGLITILGNTLVQVYIAPILKAAT